MTSHQPDAKWFNFVRKSVPVNKFWNSDFSTIMEQSILSNIYCIDLVMTKGEKFKLDSCRIHVRILLFNMLKMFKCWIESSCGYQDLGLFSWNHSPDYLWIYFPCPKLIAKIITFSRTLRKEKCPAFRKQSGYSFRFHTLSNWGHNDNHRTIGHTGHNEPALTESFQKLFLLP